MIKNALISWIIYESSDIVVDDSNDDQSNDYFGLR